MRFASSYRIRDCPNPKTLTRLSLSKTLAIFARNSLHYSAIAEAMISTEKLKAFWHSQVHDEEKWALNMKLLRAAGLFAGSIFFMRNFGEYMAI